MQGIVIDEESNYVKAAIVKIFKMQDLSDDETEAEAEAVTYALTDENGRFVIQDLDPDANYMIEIHVEDITVKVREADSMDGVVDFVEEDSMDDAVDFIEEDITNEAVNFIQTDSIGEAIVFIQNEKLTGMYFTSGLKPETELTEKLYAIKNYTW